MDSILELLGKYRCHLKRGNQSMADFLKEDFGKYISDLEKATDYNKNPLTTMEMCDLVNKYIPEVRKNAQRIVQVYNLYNEGKIVAASNKAFEVFDSMKPLLMQRYSGTPFNPYYYRIRPVNSDEKKLDRKDLFHISNLNNYLVGTERYSMPGHPCLYLASQPELAWYECGKPERFYVAKFSIPQQENDYMKFVDFSKKLMPLMYSFQSWFNNENEIDLVRNYLLKYLCTYPLRAACSVVVEHPDGKFKEEYILPQLLLQWVVNDTDLDGISYESCKESDYVKTIGGHNVVLVTKKFDVEGYDIRLRNIVKVGKPSYFDITSIDVNTDFIDNNSFYWGMEDISNEFEQI